MKNNACIVKNGCLLFDGFTLVKDSLDCVPPGSHAVINTVSPNSYGLACKDPEMMAALKGSDYLVLDGVYFGWWPLFLYGEKARRITGWDCLMYYLPVLERKGGKLFLLGSTTETLEKMRRRIREEYPSVLVETYSPPFKPVFSEEDNARMRDAVNAFAPDVLAVGMTAPKQEKWTFQQMPRLNAGISIAIGNVFDWYAGNTKRPSVFWQKMGLEWLIRIFYRPEIFKRNIANQMRFFKDLFLRLIRIKKENHD